MQKDLTIKIILGGKMKEAVKLLKALANERRLSMLKILKKGSRSVGDLCSDVHISLKAGSKHLQRLRDTGLVVSEQRGYNTFYFLSKDFDEILKRIVSAIKEA